MDASRDICFYHIIMKNTAEPYEQQALQLKCLERTKPNMQAQTTKITYTADIYNSEPQL